MSKSLSTAETVRHWLATVASDFDPRHSLRPQVPAFTLPPLSNTESRVEIEEAIGQGGMATVHRGRQLSLEREVAVKVRREDLDRGTASGILHEAWLTSALEHPNIVPIHDLSTDKAGSPQVLMRRIEGTEWGELFGKSDLIREQFGATDATDWHLRIFLQVCNAVGYAHKQGVIHRDIKPDNVMIGQYGEVYLLDWGIALAKRGPLADKLRDLESGAPAGTPCYLAPEMLKGDPDVIDERTDVYLLGATLYHLIANKPPHRGKTLEDVLNSIVENEVEVPEDLPIELQEILRKALQRSPENRFASAPELRQAVSAYLSHRSSHLLVEHAKKPLEELRSALQTRTLRSQDDRADLYRLYSSCRAHYRGALQLWEANPAALEGLHRATEAMIDAEIEHGTPRAATALLSEYEEAPEELVLRVSDAQHSEILEHADMQQMAAIARKWSSRDGAYLRIALVVSVGLFYALFATVFPTRSFVISLGADVAGLGGVVLYWLIARKRWTLNVFDTRAIGILAVVLVIQVLRRVAALAADSPPEILLIGDGLIFMMTMVVATLTLDLRLWPSALVYGAAHLLTMLAPESMSLGHGIGHLFLAMLAAWIWWPSRRRDRKTSTPQRE